MTLESKKKKRRPRKLQAGSASTEEILVRNALSTAESLVSNTSAQFFSFNLRLFMDVQQTEQQMLKGISLQYLG